MPTSYAVVADLPVNSSCRVQRVAFACQCPPRRSMYHKAVPGDLIRTGEELNMWLFTGRYAHLGTAICLVTFVVASIGIVFITTGVRLVQRPDCKVPNAVNVLLAAIPALLLGHVVGSEEQVFVSDRLNLGVALFLGVAGSVLGLIGVILPNKFRPLRVLLLFASSAVLFGDLTGWLFRSAGPSKYTSPAGLLYPLPEPRDRSADANIRFEDLRSLSLSSGIRSADRAN